MAIDNHATKFLNMYEVFGKHPRVIPPKWSWKVVPRDQNSSGLRKIACIYEMVSTNENIGVIDI